MMQQIMVVVILVTATSAITISTSAITKSRDGDIYGVGAIAMLAIFVCVFFAYNHRTYKQLVKNNSNNL